MAEPSPRMSSSPLGTPPALEAAILDVTGMICRGCALRIQDTLLASPGVICAEVDLARATARVVFVQERVLYRDLSDAVSGVDETESNRFEATVIL